MIKRSDTAIQRMQYLSYKIVKRAVKRRLSA